MAFSNFDLKKIISSASFQRQIDLIRHMGELRLTEAIWDNVYATYTPKEYERTYELLHSVTSEFKIDNNHVIIRVFCDPDKMNHYSIVEESQSKGKNFTYVPPLVNYGFSWSGWEESEPDYFHNRPHSYFLEEAMTEIQNNMQKSFMEAVVVAFNNNRYR